MKNLLFVMIICLAATVAFTPLTAILPEEKALGGTSQSPQNLPVMKLPSALTALSEVATNKTSASALPTGRKPPVQAANKWAVVIGIADYQGTGSDLWHPDEDASEMTKALVSNYGFASDHVKTLLNRRATASAIIAAINWLVANEDSNSTVVFFYSGHGFQGYDYEGWDSDIENDGIDEGIVSYDFYGLPDGYLKAKFSALQSKKVALCFGSCFSGGMFDDNDDLQAPNRIIAAACKADQYGWDYQFLGNTLWGKGFVDDSLLNQVSDMNGDGNSIEEAHAYTQPLVTFLQPDSEPQLYDNFDGEFIP